MMHKVRLQDDCGKADPRRGVARRSFIAYFEASMETPMMNQMLNITLPDDMVEMINNRVETGAYASTSDVLQAAMRLFMRTERAQDDRMAAIRAHVQAAIDDPHPGFSSEEMRQHLDALYEQNRPV